MSEKFKKNEKKQGYLIPPPNLIQFISGTKNDGDFKIIGERHVQNLIKLGKLAPDENILDVGCGCGRIAIPLTKYLRDGSYHGFDINSDVIDWCKNNIQLRFPNFHFKLIDLKNKWYNKGGKTSTTQFQFPYADETFDMVCLVSVFTHLLPDDVENYFHQISRVLKQGGRCYLTFFLLNENSKNHLELGTAKENFQFQEKGFRTIDKKIPENRVAYEESFVRELCEEYSLKINEPIHYGSWSGKKSIFYQDIFVIKN